MFYKFCKNNIFNFLVAAVMSLFIYSCQSMNWLDYKINAAKRPTYKPKFTAIALDTRVFENENIDDIQSHIIDPADGKIHLYAAGGERICFQLVIKSPKQNKINIKLSAMTTSLPSNSSNITRVSARMPIKWHLYKIISIPVKGYDAFCAKLNINETLAYEKFPDPIIELKAGKDNSFELMPNDNGLTLLLVELDVPKIKLANTYYSKIIIGNKYAYIGKDIVLHTFGFNLPKSDVSIFALIDGAEIWRYYNIGTLRNSRELVLPPDSSQAVQFANITSDFVNLAERDGLECWLSNVYPRITQNDVNWQGYQIIARDILSKSNLRRKYWLVPLTLRFPSSRNFGPPESDVYRNIIDKLLKSFNKRFIRKAAIGRAIVALAWPNSYPQALNEYQRYCSVIKTIFKTEQPVDIVNPFITVNFKPFGWNKFHPFASVDKYVNIYCPLELWLDTETIDRLHKLNKTIFWRPDNNWGTFPGAKITYPPYLIRSLAWICKRYGTDGVVLGKINSWGKSSETNAEVILNNSAKVFVYPGEWFGQSEPIGSLRLKLLSRSLQDSAYIVKLKEIGETKLADWLARNLVKYAHTDALDGTLWNIRDDGICNNIRAWHLAKLIAGYTILKHQIARNISPATQRSEKDNENVLSYIKTLKTQFSQATQSVIFELEGVKLRNVFNNSTGKYDTKISYYVVARNFSDKSVKPVISFVEKPKSYKALRDKVTLDELDWGWPVEDKLELITSTLAFGVFGTTYQPISCKIGDEATQYLSARCCALSASRLDFPVEIDGDLSDWPDMPVAGDFLRIAADSLIAMPQTEQSRQAIWKTQVKIGYDKNNLYFAFICKEPADAIKMRYSNSIAVSNGFSWGEDLIEIFIDPDNTAALDPMKVYHIILKTNGTVIAIKGPSEAYRQGAYELWPADISAAVRVYKEFWQAEVRIPFDAFKKDDINNKWWGIDFARTSAAIGEISSWSGTKSQFGRPISLGNIFIDR